MALAVSPSLACYLSRNVITRFHDSTINEITHCLFGNLLELCATTGQITHKLSFHLTTLSVSTLYGAEWYDDDQLEKIFHKWSLAN
jgi:hypothetical protein